MSTTIASIKKQFKKLTRRQLEEQLLEQVVLQAAAKHVANVEAAKPPAPPRPPRRTDTIACWMAGPHGPPTAESVRPVLVSAYERLNHLNALLACGYPFARFATGFIESVTHQLGYCGGRAFWLTERQCQTVEWIYISTCRDMQAWFEMQS